MSVRDWFQNLDPKRKFAIKTITKVAAVSVPYFGNQLHTLFETTFEELKDHEEAHELIELTQLVNQRFDQLITQVESRASTEHQIEALITLYLNSNQQTNLPDLHVIDQHIVRVQESLGRLYSGVHRVEAKVDQMGQQLDSLWAEISQAEVNAERREDDAKAERSEIKQMLHKFMRQIMVQSRGSLSDSLSIQADQDKRLIRHLLSRFRAFPQRDRESFEIGNDLSVLLTTANMYTEADEVLNETIKVAETQVEKGLIHFNRYMNALKANRLDEALDHYNTAIEADRTLALFPPHKFKPLKILGFGAFGVTFLCDQFSLKVAVKSIALNRALGDSEEVVNRLAQEWTTLMSLSDPRIIRARDFDPNRQHNGELRPYLTMEYFPGDNLQVYCEKHPEAFGLKRLEHTLKVALEIVKGLHAAHQKQVIHRDIKPANILYRGDESGFDLRIIDFGLALPPQNMSEQSMFMSQRFALSQQGSILANTIAGTLKYAPPEQLGEGGSVGPHSDVYSWGRTLNYLLFGRTDPRIRELRHLDEKLQELLDDCLEPDTEQRVQHFDYVIQSLVHRTNDLINAKSISKLEDESNQGSPDELSIKPKEHNNPAESKLNKSEMDIKQEGNTSKQPKYGLLGEDIFLSEESINSLLSAVDEGKIRAVQTKTTLDDSGGSGSKVIKYDLLSQDRVIRGRLPTLDIINDRFARQLRITLSNSIHKVMQVSVENTTLMKYGEFLNYLPASSCFNIVRFQPLRGSCIVTIEMKLIYAFTNNFFGGVTNPKEKFEGRDFTAIELMIIRKLMNFVLEEYERCWQPVYQINSEYIRTETNPQFLTVVPLSDVVLVTSFELEMENLRGMIQIMIPDSTIKPIRHHLTAGIQSEDDEISISWYDQIEYQLQDSEVDLDVLLGRAQLTIEQMLDLEVGDVLMLNQNQNTPLKLRIEGTEKYLVEPLECSGVISVKVLDSIQTQSKTQ